jgi:long-chain fatty acid transport protein
LAVLLKKGLLSAKMKKCRLSNLIVPFWHSFSITRPMQKYLFSGLSVLLCAFALLTNSVFADGIFRNGVGARSMAMGGADVGYASDSLGSMAANPAGLGFLSATELDLSLNGVMPYGHFSRPPNSDSDLNNPVDFFPDAAFALHLQDFPVTFGLSFVTDSGMDANWNYVDPAGGLGGVSYGQQRDNSKITLFRSALGAGMNLGEKWSVGANFGLVYNQNELQTPYVFQSAPGLAGAKTLLDLSTDGFGYNALVGVLFRPAENLQFGLSYKSPATIYSHGDANGNAGVQGVPGNFHYDAQVKNVIPQSVSAGSSWQFTPQWRLALQLDWINWADAFNTLAVSLHNGSSPSLPGTINDNVPLDWHNEFVYRAGLEYGVTTNLVLRGGYCYGQSPVPDATLTPLTAAILEHTLTAGIGYHWKRYQFDLAYQWDIPITRNVGTSGLLSGEYSNSSIRVGAQTLALSTGIKF